MNFVKFDQGFFHTRFFEENETHLSKLPTNTDQLFNYGDKINLKKFNCGNCYLVYLSVSSIRADLSLYLHRPEDFLTPEQIEGHLPEENINGILGNPGKTGAESIVVQMA